MTAALIGLVGIVVGAGLTGFVDIVKDWKREKALAQGVVKVLALDLIELDSQLRWSLEDRLFHLSASEAARITETWLANRDLLARKLSPDAWATIARVFQSVLIWTDRDDDRLDERDQRQITAWVGRVQDARQILEHWPRAASRDVSPQLTSSSSPPARADA